MGPITVCRSFQCFTPFQFNQHPHKFHKTTQNHFDILVGSRCSSCRCRRSGCPRHSDNESGSGILTLQHVVNRFLEILSVSEPLADLLCLFVAAGCDFIQQTRQVTRGLGELVALGVHTLGNRGKLWISLSHEYLGTRQ